MSVLNKILKVKKEEVAKLHQSFTRNYFYDNDFYNRKRMSLSESLTKNGKINIITEVKKASPSKGILKENFNHLDIAKIYMSNCADAISVLTDKEFFLGDITFLKEISSIKTVPLLRKDFIIDEFQILEAKANGADAVLLIAEALSKNQINELSNIAEENDLEVLLEIHSEKQLDKIDFEKNKIIGINNRNLETFEVDLDTTVRIIPLLPDNIVVISESGISTKENIELLKSIYVDAILIGEHLMRSGELDKSLQQLNKWCKYES